jgi:hypothetical protein
MNTVRSTELTPAACKLIVREFLDERRLPYERLSARTIDFSDLARARVIFVSVHGWQPSPAWEELRALAFKHAFRVEGR